MNSQVIRFFPPQRFATLIISSFPLMSLCRVMGPTWWITWKNTTSSTASCTSSPMLMNMPLAISRSRYYSIADEGLFRASFCLHGSIKNSEVPLQWSLWQDLQWIYNGYWNLVHSVVELRHCQAITMRYIVTWYCFETQFCLPIEFITTCSLIY